MRQGPITDMSAPQRDVLAATAAHRTVDRVSIDETLEHGGTSIAYQTLYHHLESLVENGLVEKQSGGNGFLNQYRITREGLRTLNTHRDWLDECLEDAAPIVEVQR